MNDPLDRPLSTLAADLREQRLSAAELCTAASARHAARGALLGAYQHWSAEAARQEAQAADLVFAAAGPLGPLQGLPVSVKDHFGLKGYATYAGTGQRLPAQWEQEGPLIKRLRNQLGVVTGKTIAVELAFGGLGVNNTWGTPRNPWDATVQRVPGGSSSGAGVSLWEGSALLALGTDTGGSVRIPASMTGTVGLKTSGGRWPLAGVVPLSPTLDTVGVLTRTVADAVYAFAAFDPAWGEPGKLADYLRGLDLDAVRLGVADALLWDGCDPGIVETVQQALREAAARGAKLKDTPLPEAVDALALIRSGSVVAAECDAFLEAELPAWRAHLDPIITARIGDGGAIPAREYLIRQHRIRKLTLTAPTRFAEVDVIVCPTVPITPPPLADMGVIDTYRRLNLLSLRNTCVANFLGLCALSLPVGLDAAGMPVGMQLMAQAGQEERLLAVALALEGMLGTARERLGVPPLCRD